MEPTIVLLNTSSLSRMDIFSQLYLFRSVGLDHFILGHCVVEGLLLVNLVADPLALGHILLHIDCLLTRGHRLVHRSALLLPADVWNGDIPSDKEYKTICTSIGCSEQLAHLQTGILRGTWRQTCWGACEQHCCPDPAEQGWFWRDIQPFWVSLWVLSTWP